MANTVKCIYCGRDIEISEALTHEIKEKVLKQERERQKQELARFKKQIQEDAMRQALQRAKSKYESELHSAKTSEKETLEQNKKLQSDMSSLLKQLRELKNSESKMKIEYEKKLMQEQDKIKQLARREAEEELNLQIMSREKKLADAQKQIQELQRKIQMGSQQIQGEVMENEFEEVLAREFGDDNIKEVPKGVRGADIIQEVRTRSGVNSGKILWEIKNTKTWSKSWLTKLKQDQRDLKADIAVIVSRALPDGVENFAVKKGIWITSPRLAVGLGHALRQQIVRIFQAKSAARGRKTSAEAVYDYLTSNEFRQRIETIVEYFDQRREEINKEKNYFLKKWESEEKNIYKALGGAAGIYGDLQGITNSALPKVSSLELPEEL